MTDRVKNLCVSFLKTYFGPHGKRRSREDQRSFGLRLVSLGSPELTVQGELVYYLRSKGVNAVSECAVGPRSNRDLVIFDDHWKAVCAIELKHRSANQGRATILFRDMTADAQKHRRGRQKDLPLIQLGLFTEVSRGLGQKHPATSGLYRFLSTYVKKTVQQTIEAQIVPRGYTGKFAAPAPTQISIGSSVVVGRVGWIINTVPGRLE